MREPDRGNEPSQPSPFTKQTAVRPVARLPRYALSGQVRDRLRVAVRAPWRPV